MSRPALGTLCVAFFCAQATLLHAAPRFADAREAAAKTRDAQTRTMLERLVETHEKLGTAFGLETRLLISDASEVNAFAGHLQKQKVVVLNLGLIEALRDDEDAIAAALAHEVAHHARNHVKSGNTKRRVLGILGVVGGAVLDQATGGSVGDLAYDATGFAASLLSSKFNRDQERQADSDGLTRMVAAGYNPRGAIRMHQVLLAHGSGQSGFRSSHPGGADRIESLEKLIAASPDAQKLAQKEKVALYVPGASASSGAVGDSAELAALLEPIDGITLDRYAAMSNQIAASDGSPAAYEKLGTTEKEFESLSARWTERMRADTTASLGQRFAIAYVEASSGRFAPYGRSAAKLMRGEEVDEEAPPLPLTEYIAASKAIQKAAREGAAASDFETKVTRELAPFKLSLYEWSIVQSWWTQRLMRDQEAMLAYARGVTAPD
jgi:Zn-dependent protease with chaperone function